MVSRFFTIICIFFSKRAEKGIFHACKSQWLGDTLVIHFLYETQLTVVNCIVAGQGYQNQATRWRELSILLGAQWYIFDMITFFTELTHQSDAELVTMKVCRVYHHVSPRRITRLRLGDTGFSLQKCITDFVTKLYHQGGTGLVGFGRYQSVSPDLGWVIRFPRYKIVSPNLTLD